MQAAIYRKYGPPSVVQIEDIPVPEPSENEVLIQVCAATVNRTDCGFRSAQYFVSRFFSGLLKPKFHVLGNEFAGIVVQTGQNVSKWKTGDRVFGYNDETFGAHAEYMVMPANGSMALIPQGFTFEQAAPLTEGLHYAIRDINAGEVKPGDRVLVNGATGAIGSAAVQILKHMGAEVTGVCNTQNLELVRRLGADVVIDYTNTDFTQTSKKYSFVFDAVGKSSFKKCKKILTPKGVYISTELGKNSANIWLALITPFLGGKRAKFPLPTMNREITEQIKELAENGNFRPVIDRTYRFEQIVEAHEYADSGQKTGNLVIQISEK